MHQNYVDGQKLRGQMLSSDGRTVQEDSHHPALASDGDMIVS